MGSIHCVTDVIDQHFSRLCICIEGGVWHGLAILIAVNVGIIHAGLHKVLENGLESQHDAVSALGVYQFVSFKSLPDFCFTDKISHLVEKMDIGGYEFGGRVIGKLGYCVVKVGKGGEVAFNNFFMSPEENRCFYRHRCFSVSETLS